MIGGPGCQAWRALTEGRQLVGRSPSCDLVIEDPTVELHHGILDTTGDTITFTQLTGRVPARLDGELCAADQSIEPGRSLHLGASRIVFRGVGESPAGSRRWGQRTTGRPLGSIVPSESDPWRRVVRRGPARPDADSPPPVAVPAAPAEHRAPPFTGLAGAAVAAAGAGLMAVVLGQPLFAAFALLGAIASVSTWVVGAWRARRRRRRAAALHRARAREVLVPTSMAATAPTPGPIERITRASRRRSASTNVGSGNGEWSGTSRCG